MLTMAHKLYYRFRQRWTYTGDPKQKVFQAAKSGNAVRLDKVLHLLDFTERVFVLDKQYILDGCSLPGKEKSSSLVSPLVVAVQNGNLDCVKVLLSYGADIEVRGDFKYVSKDYPFHSVSFEACTPLFVAAAVNGNVGILSCLLDSGADLNAVTNTEEGLYTPLMMAVRYRRIDAVKFLMDQGADANLQDKKGYTALHYVAMYYCSFDAIHLCCFNIQDADNLTPLMIAVNRLNLNVVNYFLQNGAYLDLEDRYAQRCLQLLFDVGLKTSCEILSSLIRNGADVNARVNEMNQTLLMLATFQGSGDIRSEKFKLLIENGANLDLQDKSGNTALHYAVNSRDMSVILVYAGASQLCNSQGLTPLLAANKMGFNVNAINNKGNTPLHLAVSNIHLLTDTLEVLFDGGAHHDFVNNDGKTPMDMAKTNKARMILSERRKLELKCICARAVKIFGIPYMGLVPKTLEKYITAKSGDSVLLNEVLEKLDNTERISVLGVDFQYIGDGCPLSASDESPVTPLTVAVRNGNLDCVKVLLKYGAEIEGRGDFMHIVEHDSHPVPYNYKCCTALFIAATCGNVETLRFLVENGGDVNAADDLGLTPLMAAVKNQFLDAVIFLIDQGADVNLQDSSGLTALHYATEVSFDPSSCLIVKQLINGGANINAVTKNDKCTPLMLASSRFCDEETVTLLIEQGAYVDLQDQKGNTALHNVVRRKSEEMVGTLLNAGASNLCNSQGMTPLLLGCSKGYVAVVENLIKQPEITKEQRINALELLGASVLIEECILENADLHDLKGFKYIKHGMIERFADHSHPLFLFKQEMEPVEAYQNRRECQTLEELAEIEGDRDAIIMESLLIKERIMGRNYEDLIAVIRNVARYYEDHDLSSCIKLYRHAMKTAPKCDVSAVDLSIITSALFNRFENGDLSKEEDFLDVPDKTILDHDHEIQRKMTNEQDSWYDMLYLFDSLQKLVFVISKFECADEGRLSSSALLLKTISNLNLRDSDSNTILHRFAIHHGRCSSYSYSGAVKLLLNAGFNVNAINSNGDTVLHIVATLKPSDDKIHLLTDCCRFCLMEVHMMILSTCSDGKTPMNMAGTDEARMILSERRKLELKCISARAVKRFGIPYLG
ncbi:unnamed protein product [Porites evermanni]|uniref:Uncharacterized protein n=1 Tax=Porites evermanni TaxID=104178 RepID=A0ABN8REH4_9CNID|nr:unnamed protein product [Porites evermanni]